MYTLQSIIESLPRKKNSNSSLWVKLVIRKVSFLVTFCLINLGFSAWGVSILSVLVALLGSLCLGIDSQFFRLVGVFLINFWLVLDCVDGNIARIKKQSSPKGEFVDALSGYYVSAFVYLGISLGAYFTSSLPINPIVFVVAGAICSLSGILARLIHQKYIHCDDLTKLNSQQQDDVKKSRFSHLRNRIDKELGISGLFMPFLVCSVIFNFLDIMLIFYLLFQGLGLIAVTLLYSIRAKV